MIKIKKFDEIKNTLFKRLFERNMELIQSFRTTDDIDLEIFELFYELEYKYSQIRDRLFTGIEKRRENILRIIEDKAEEVNIAIADSFVGVFKIWLDSHALTEPKKWAKQRIYGDNKLDAYGSLWSRETVSGIVHEYCHYLGYTTSSLDILLEHAIERIDNLPILKEAFTSLIKEEIELNLDDLDWEEFEDMYSRSFLDNSNLKNEDEVRDFLENIPFLSQNEFISNYNIPELFEDNQSFVNFIDNFDAGEILVELNEKMVFPLWYGHWKAEGIDKTRKDVEDIHKKIKRISSYPIEKQFMYINIATNTTHQTGSMMDYYEEQYEVTKTDLERLSNIDTRDWDKELREIGVDI